MAQRIMVLSPLHQMGTSAVCALLSQYLSQNGKSSLLCYTDKDSYLPSYYGIDISDDPTRSVMQVARLIDAGAIQNKDILTYSYQYAKNAYLLNMADDAMDYRSASQILTHVYSRVNTDIIICDVTEDLWHETTKKLFETADLVFIVIQPYEKCYARLRDWLTREPLASRDDVYCIINYYNEVIAPVRSIARTIGLPAVRVCKVHYNPWITYCASVGQIQTMTPNMTTKSDPRLSNLVNDFTELKQCIFNAELTQQKNMSKK